MRWLFYIRNIRLELENGENCAVTYLLRCSIANEILCTMDDSQLSRRTEHQQSASLSRIQLERLVEVDVVNSHEMPSYSHAQTVGDVQRIRYWSAAQWRANCRRTSEYDGRLATTSACSSDGRSAFLGDRLHHLAERLSWTFSNVADVGAHLPVQLLSLDHGLWKWLTVSMVIHFRILTSLHCAVNHRLERSSPNSRQRQHRYSLLFFAQICTHIRPYFYMVQWLNCRS